MLITWLISCWALSMCYEDMCTISLPPSGAFEPQLPPEPLLKGAGFSLWNCLPWGPRGPAPTPPPQPVPSSPPMGTLVAKLLLPTLSSLAFLPTVSIAAKRRFHMEAMVYLFTMFFVAVSLHPGVGAGGILPRAEQRGHPPAPFLYCDEERRFGGERKSPETRRERVRGAPPLLWASVSPLVPGSCSETDEDSPLRTSSSRAFLSLPLANSSRPRRLQLPLSPPPTLPAIGTREPGPGR